MKRILVDATGSSGWIGGVYHKKNILFSLLLNESIKNTCQIVVVTNPEYIPLFKEFSGRIKLRTIQYDGIREKKVKLALLALTNRCKYLFPNTDNRICKFLHLTGINWVPDYQHYHYPDFFTTEELESRKLVDKQTYTTSYPLVLSSQTCLNDFRKFCSESKKNIYVVPFVSYIEKEVRSLNDSYVSDVCSKYGVKPGTYAMVANQFWQHKNHSIVFEAIKLIHYELDPVAKIVYTGQLSDYRTNDYIERIKDLLNTPSIADRSVCTGFISRMEQLALMKGSKFLIQPSLFEGWGTVLEDAKVLDKNVLLSDIPIHREQMNNKCTLFDPYDAESLGKLIVDTWNAEYPDDMSFGIDQMYKSAITYSKEFERLIAEN